MRPLPCMRLTCLNTAAPMHLDPFLVNISQVVFVLHVLEGMRAEHSRKVLAASSRSVGERAWLLPRRLHPLDEAVQAVRSHTATYHSIVLSYLIAWKSLSAGVGCLGCNA